MEADLEQITILVGKQEGIISFLNDLDPSLFQGVVLGVLAFLIPVGVGILGFFFQEQAKKKLEAHLELVILLDEVLHIKRVFFVSVGALLIFSLGSQDSHWIFKIVWTTTLFLFLFTFISPFWNIYNWAIKGPEPFAPKLLKKISVGQSTKIKKAFTSLWQAKQVSREFEFIDIFIQKIDEALKAKKLKLAEELCMSFMEHLENRDAIWIGANILPKVLEWSGILWETKLTKPKQNKFQEWALVKWNKVFPKKIEDKWENVYFYQYDFLPAIIEKLLKEDRSYNLFEALKKYIDSFPEKLKEETFFKQHIHYFEGIIQAFCRAFFENVEKSKGKYHIWKGEFPAHWKITRDNLEKHIVARRMLHEFGEWSEPRIQNPQEEWDKDLEQVIQGIFPEVDPMIFSWFLIAFLTPYSHESRMRNVIEREWNFGKVGRGYGAMDPETADQEFERLRTEEQKNTFELILHIFGKSSFFQDLRKYETELKKLQYEKDSRNESKRKRLLSIIQHLIALKEEISDIDS